MDIYQKLAHHMNTLGLQITGEQLASICVQAGRAQMDTSEFLAHVVKQLVDEKRQRSFDMLLKLSGIPVEKTLESFDFDFQPELDENQIRQLATLDFVRAKKNIVFLAKPGR